MAVIDQQLTKRLTLHWPVQGINQDSFVVICYACTNLIGKKFENEETTFLTALTDLVFYTTLTKILSAFIIPLLQCRTAHLNEAIGI